MSLADTINLEHNPNIQTFKFISKLDYNTAHNLMFLFSRRGTSRIQQITLELWDPSPVGSEWREVAEILGGDHYAALQRVTVSFNRTTTAICDSFNQQLPLLASRGVLQVIRSPQDFLGFPF